MKKGPDVRPLLEEMLTEHLEKLTEYFTGQEEQPHRLTKVQFQRQKNTETESRVPQIDPKLVAGQLASKIVQAQLKDREFNSHQQTMNAFKQALVVALNDKPITADNVEATLKNWLEQREQHYGLKPIAESSEGATSIERLKPELLTDPLLGSFIQRYLRSPFLRTQLTEALRFLKVDTALTEDDVKAASRQWDVVQNSRIQRFEEKVRGGTKTVEEWNRVIPNALTYEQMSERERLNPYKEDEEKDYRSERRRQVPGNRDCLSYMKQKEVAKDTAGRFRSEKKVLPKQHHELPEAIRLEMQQKLGIVPVSRSREGMASAVIGAVVGTRTWQTKFEGAMFDPELPTLFPERQERIKEKLTPLFQRRVEMQAKLEDSGNSVDPEVEQLAQNLARIKV